MKLKRLLALVVALVAVTWAIDETAFAAKKSNKITQAQRKAAAQRLAKKGLKPGVAGLAATTVLPLPGSQGPGGIPHYFGPYGNWAYSPLPSFGLLSTVTVDSPGSGYHNAVVTITDVYGTGTAAATAALDANGAITAITVGPGSAGFHVPFVSIVDDPTTCGGAVICGSGAAATASIDFATLTGGMRKFVDGLPGLGPTNANTLGQYIPVAAKQQWPVGCQGAACTADYYEIALVEFTEKMHSDLPQATRLRGYVQLSTTAVPGKGVLLFNPDGSPIMMPDGVTQAKGVDNPHYLGPAIVAQGRAVNAGAAGAPWPVRIKFYNLLPTGSGGNLFLPVDETVPGAGVGPSVPGSAPGEKFAQNRATVHLHGNNTVWISDGNTHQWISPAGEATSYPAGVSARNVPDDTSCDADPVGNPGKPGSSGCLIFYYTNAQSARLQFYHDHAHGITRLNVYGGEAAGYVLTDAVEADMIAGSNVTGVNCFDPPTCSISKKVLPDVGIPLVIQDRTWVDADTVFAQDPTWNSGTGPRDPVSGNITGAVTGDLWYPHVYMSAQNPWDLAGVNAYGRWHYGPWFNPPVPECLNGGPVGCIELGPVPNDYHQADCDLTPPGPGCTQPWEPPMRPGVPNPSIAGEAFMDTPTVNGTAYPVLKVEPKAYRFRILNAANDRFLNLQLYKAFDKTSWVPGTGSANPGSPTTPCAAPPADPTVCTEVKMISVAGAPNQQADWPSGIPDPLTKGPDWILIGTEGGFLPKPVLVPQQPIGWNLNPTTFNYGNVNQHSLLVGSAERADVIVDFSAYPNQTFIVYNDAPAAFPAGVPTYDYFTGVADQVDVGGAPGTRPGYGPNTRTIMQIQVGNSVSTPTTDVTLANLQAVFAKTAAKPGVFQTSQDPIIIPQAEYNSAYNASFPTSAAAQYLQIADTAKTFQPIDQNGVLQPALTLPLEMKAMHDEMGGVYDTQFGRMSGMLGLTNPLSPVHVLIPYGYSSPPTDIVKGSLEGTPVGTMPDGTQIWRIFHNGVDTHTIHTHLFHAQLVNRIGQDGIQLGTDPIELGWKDTFRVNPLEITYLAMRPTVPAPAQLPFEAPDSVRLIDPTLPDGATLPPPPPAGWFDPAGNAITDILNHTVNFGWEYVWHCHILAHEEMDMMHSLVFAVPPKAPTLVSVLSAGTNPVVTLTWTDNSTKEVQFTIQRATNATFTAGLTQFVVGSPTPPNSTGGTLTYQDKSVAKNTQYWYRVFANGGPVGDLLTAGFPTMSADSISLTLSVLTGTAPFAPAAPTNLTATPQAGPQVSLTWRDNATNETGFYVERCTVVPPATTCSNFAQIAAPGPRNNTGNVTYFDATVAYGNSYIYRVAAFNAGGSSAYVTMLNPVVVPALPPAPTNFTVSAVKSGTNSYTASLNWGEAINPASFTIQRASNSSFTTGLSSFTAAGTARTLTQTVSKNTVYYYRIRANNSIGGSSAWTNALPFPIRTGP